MLRPFKAILVLACVLFSFISWAGPSKLSSCRARLISQVSKLSKEVNHFVVDASGNEYLRTNRGWDRLRREWFADVEGHESDGSKRRLKYPKISTILDLENLRGKRVLDAATGDGQFVEELITEGVDVIGVDLKLQPNQKGRKEFIEADLAETGLPSESFEVIISAYGPYFYYVNAEPYAAITKEMARLLTPGGKLVLIKAFNGQDEFLHSKQIKLIYPGEERLYPFGNFVLEKIK